MTLEEFRNECAWSKAEMARQVGIDVNTLNKAIDGVTVSANSANKLARAISKELNRTIRAKDIEGLNYK